MRNILECNNDNIAVLIKLRWRTLRVIKKMLGLGSFYNLLKDSLGQSIIMLHMYVNVMDVCNKLATMTFAKQDKVDYFLIDKMYRKQFMGQTLPPTTGMNMVPSAVAPTPIITPPNAVNHSQLDLTARQTIDFICFTNLRLHDTSDIMQFYCDVFTQGF